MIQFTPSNREYSLLNLSDVKRATDATKGSGVGKIFVFEKETNKAVKLGSL